MSDPKGRDDFSSFRGRLPPLEPPPRVRAELLAEVARTPQEAGVDLASPAARRRMPWGLGIAAAAALLGSVLWLGQREQGEESGDAARPTPAAPADVARARAEDVACDEREKETLRAQHAGRWAVIAGGRLVARGVTREKALAVEPLAPHRFVFEIGTEGDREDFVSQWYAPRFAGMGLTV